MNIAIEAWQLDQLRQLSTQNPARMSDVFGMLWSLYPDLFREVVLGALDQNQIHPAHACELLRCESEQLELLLSSFQSVRTNLLCKIAVCESRGVALVRESQIPVWEIVWEFKKLGSVEALKDKFPNLAISDLNAALAYSENHPAEIEEQLMRYENHLKQREALKVVSGGQI